MDIYHALINALSAHMIHINLNMIFYTHVEHKQFLRNIRIAPRTAPAYVTAVETGFCKSISKYSDCPSGNRR